MKNKITITIIALSFSGLVANAQDFGLKAGISMNSITGFDESFNSSSGSSMYSSETKGTHLLGYTVGATFEKLYNDRIGLVTGLTYRNGGGIIHSEWSEESNNSNYVYSMRGEENTKIKINYVEIPLQMKGVLKVKDQKIYGLFGGYVGMALSGNYTYAGERTETFNGETSNYSYESEPEKLDFSFGGNDFQSLNYGLIPGVGVEINKFQIEFTYNIGLSNLINDDDYRLKTRSFNLMFGYRFSKD